MGEARIDFRILNHSVTCFRFLILTHFPFLMCVTLCVHTLAVPSHDEVNTASSGPARTQHTAMECPGEKKTVLVIVYVVVVDVMDTESKMYMM